MTTEVGVDTQGIRFKHRVAEVFADRYAVVTGTTDRMFAWLMLAQWLAAIGLAYWLSPLAWAGRESVVHGHVYAAVFLGGLISGVPMYLAIAHPSKPMTRYAVGIGQAFWSGLLIHLTGGRIETHFHIFGSLALMAFYRDVRVLIPATVVVAADHFVRGVYWPESIYGVANPAWWRFLEHAGWVVFIDTFLIFNCIAARRELLDLCSRQVELEFQREKMVTVEKLAAIGQLAASVGHELRNPLAAIKNAHTYIQRKMGKSNGANLSEDARVQEFMNLINRELEASNKIISNLLDFSRPREPTTSPTPLRPLIEEVLAMLPPSPRVTLHNDVPSSLPIPNVDKDQFRQVFLNLVQNGVEAIPVDEDGTVRVSATLDDDGSILIEVTDDGPGIEEDVLERIMQPLFSTKTKGTGLGLAVVEGIVERHGGELTVRSEVSQGTTFTTRLPASASNRRPSQKAEAHAI